jgi:hypothetical protein
MFLCFFLNTYLHFFDGLHVNLKITKAVAGNLHMSYVEAYTAVVIFRVNDAEGISGPIYIVPIMGVMVGV